MRLTCCCLLRLRIGRYAGDSVNCKQVSVGHVTTLCDLSPTMSGSPGQPELRLDPLRLVSSGYDPPTSSFVTVSLT